MRSRVLILLCAILLIGTGIIQARTPEYGGTLHLYNGEDWETLDPAYASGFDSGAMTVKIFDGLVRFDYYSNDIVPCLATDWEVSKDRLTYTFHLREGVTFHNGRILTAHDVKYSFDRLFDPTVKSPGTWAYKMIQGTDEALAGTSDGVCGVKVIDDNTISFELKYPFGLFVKHLTLPYALVVPREVVAEYGQLFSDHAVGTGPFQLVEWDHDNKLILQANENYFAGRPFVDKIIYRVIAEELTAMAEFEAGNLDLVTVPEAEFDLWVNDPKWKDYLVKQTDLSTYYLALNQNVAPLDNLLVRKAISHAIDVKTILKALRYGRDTQASGPIPPGIEGFVDLPPVEYNPELAKKLLKEAGYPDGFEIEIWTTTSADRVQMVSAFQAYLAEVGIDVQIIKNEWAVFFAAVKKGVVPMYYLSWFADYADPYNFLEPLLSSEDSRVGMNDSDIDAILDVMARTNDPATRYGLAETIVERTYELQPYIWLYHSAEYYLKQPRIQGEIWHQMYDADKMTTIWIDE